MSVDHDRLFKLVLSAFPLEFLTLFARPPVRRHEITRVELVDTQLLSDLPGGERRHADLVFKPYSGSPEAPQFLIHVEIRSQPQGNFPQRSSYAEWKERFEALSRKDAQG